MTSHINPSLLSSCALAAARVHLATVDMAMLQAQESKVTPDNDEHAHTLILDHILDVINLCYSEGCILRK